MKIVRINFGFVITETFFYFLPIYGFIFEHTTNNADNNRNLSKLFASEICQQKRSHIESVIKQ